MSPPMFGGETVSLFEVLAGVLKGHFGKMFFGTSDKIVQQHQAIIELLIRQSFLLVLARIQVGPPTFFSRYGAMKHWTEPDLSFGHKPKDRPHNSAESFLVA
jgi:hypothetical protein